MAINDVSDISFNNLAQNAKNYKSKIQDKKKNNYSMNMSKRTEKNINDLVISSNKAILLATKLANENKKFSAQYSNIPDRLKQIKKEKAKIKRESTVNSAKSPTMAVLSIDKNVKKIYNLLNKKFGTATSKKSKNLLDASAAYDAKKLGIEGTGKKWKADIFSFIKAAMRQSTLNALKVDQDTYFHSRFGEGEKKKGFLGSAVRAYKVASDETTMSTQEKMVKALIEINRSLSGKDSVFRLTYERLLMEHATFRNIVWTIQKAYDSMALPFRIYNWATKSRGGYKSYLPRGKGSAEHTAAVLDMIYVDSMWRLDNIVHHLKQQYNLWNKYMMSQDGTSANDPTDISKGTYSFAGKISNFFKKFKAKDAPEYQKYHVTQKDLLEKQVKIGYAQVALLKIIASNAGSNYTAIAESKKLANKISIGRIDADNRLDEDDYYTDKKHKNRLLFWRANAKLEKNKQSKFEKTQAKIEENRKKIETRKANILAKRKWKAYKKDPNGYAKDLNDQADENLSLAMQAGPAHLAIAAGKKIGKSKIYKSTIAKMKGFNESASDKIDNAKNKAIAGTYKFLSPNSSPSRVREAANKQLAGQDNITDRLVLKMDQLIRQNSVANKLRHNSYRLSFKSFLADEKARLKAKFKSTWLGGILSKGWGLMKSGFGSVIKALTLGYGVKGLLKLGVGAISSRLFTDGFKKAAMRKMKGFGAKLMTGRGMAGAAGVGMAAYDAYGGVKKAKEWGTNKFIGGVAGALGGTGDGGVGSALKGAAKGAGIGMMIGGPLGAAIGGIAGGLLGYFGGKNIAKALNPVWEGIKKLWTGIKKMVMFPIDAMKWVGEKFVGLFGSLKDLASSGINAIHSFIYNKSPAWLQVLLPKPKDTKKKSPDEVAKNAIEEAKKAKKSDTSGTPSLVSDDMIATVEQAKTASMLPTITDKLAVAKKTQDDEVKKFGFDHIRLSPEEQQKEKERQAKYAKDNSLWSKTKKNAGAALASVPLNEKQLKESGKKIQHSKFGQAASDTWGILTEGTQSIYEQGKKKLKYAYEGSDVQKSVQTFNRDNPDFINDATVTWQNFKRDAEALSIRGEGRLRNLKMKYDNSDFAHQIGILAIKAEWNWKKFKESPLFKYAQVAEITSEEKFNQIVNDIKHDPKFQKKLNQVQEFIDEPKSRVALLQANSNELSTYVKKQLPTKEKREAVVDSLKENAIDTFNSIKNIDVKKLVQDAKDSPIAIRTAGVLKSPENAEIIAKELGNKALAGGKKIVEKGKELGHKAVATAKDSAIVTRGQGVLKSPENALIIAKELGNKALVGGKKIVEKGKDAIDSSKTKMDLFLKNKRKYYFDQYTKFKKEYSTSKDEMLLGMMLTSSINFKNNTPAGTKIENDKKEILTIGNLAKKYSSDESAKTIIDNIINNKTENDMITIPTSKGLLATERRTSSFSKKDLEQAKKTNQKGLLLGIKTLDKQLIQAKAKGDQVKIDSLLKARKKLISKLDPSNASTVTDPPVMTSKDIASTQIEQERIRAINQDKSLNSALGKQTTNINKNQQESAAQIIASNSSMVHNITSSNSSNVSTVNNNSDNGGRKPQSDAFGDAVLAGQFDNF